MKTNHQDNISKSEFQKALDKLKKRKRRTSLLRVISVLSIGLIILYVVYNNSLRNAEMQLKDDQIEKLNGRLIQRDSLFNILQNQTVMLLDSIEKVVLKRDNDTSKGKYYNKKMVKILDNPDAIIAKVNNWSGSSNNINFRNLNVVLNGKGEVRLRTEIESPSKTGGNGSIVIEFIDSTITEVYSRLWEFNIKPVPFLSGKSNLTRYDNIEFTIPGDSSSIVEIETIKIKAIN